MRKYGGRDILRAIFGGFFVLVGLTSLFFVGFHELTEVPKYIARAVLLLCFGGIF